jgi:hypothetical protein
MKRIIRLTESDLKRIVRRVINEAPQAGRATAALGPLTGQKTFKYNKTTKQFDFYLYGDSAGNEPGYWKSGEKFTSSVGFSFEGYGGVISGTWVPVAGNYSDTTGTFTTQLGPLTEDQLRKVQECKKGTNNFIGQEGNSFEKALGLPRCGYFGKVSFSVDLPKSPAKNSADKSTLIGYFDFSDSQVQIVAPEKADTYVNRLNIYMPPNSVWGVGGKTVTPKPTTPVVKKG